MVSWEVALVTMIVWCIFHDCSTMYEQIETWQCAWWCSVVIMICSVWRDVVSQRDVDSMHRQWSTWINWYRYIDTILNHDTNKCCYITALIGKMPSNSFTKTYMGKAVLKMVGIKVLR